MINLIPNEEKKKIVKNFYYRFAVLFLAALSFAIFAATVALVPSYLISSVKKNAATEKLVLQENEPVPLPDQETLASIKNLNSKIAVIESARQNKFQVSRDVISEIIHQKMPDIKISQISYENTQAAGKKIIIQGRAPNRDRLLLFRLAVENDPMFKKVELPISNFIKGSNIQFSMSLTPSDQ